jgi:hypothetical protein
MLNFGGQKASDRRPLLLSPEMSELTATNSLNLFDKTSEQGKRRSLGASGLKMFLGTPSEANWWLLRASNVQGAPVVLNLNFFC